jgi:predicted Zn-dependent protease
VDLDEVSRFVPADFRTGIQWLLANDKIELAQALADAGLSLHPYSEDVLAIAGLMAAAQQDWPLTIELLQDLRKVQQGQVQPMTYQMLARALFCNSDRPQARLVLEEGLRAWPADPILSQELIGMADSIHSLPTSAPSN